MSNPFANAPRVDRPPVAGRLEAGLWDELAGCCDRDGHCRDLGGAALLLGRIDRPLEDLQHYHRHLAQLAQDVAGFTRAKPGPEDQAEALREILARRYGYRGNPETYEERASANLLSVVDRRHGLPVVLGVLYVHVARAQGWDAAGIAFPGHFLVRLTGGRKRLILDPFNGGIDLGAQALRDLLKSVAGAEAELVPSLFTDVSDRAILLRIQNNTRGRLERSGDASGALILLESMLALDPAQASLWRDYTRLALQCDQPGTARDAAQRYLFLADTEQQRQDAAGLLAALNRQLN